MRHEGDSGEEKFGRGKSEGEESGGGESGEEESGRGESEGEKSEKAEFGEGNSEREKKRKSMYASRMS